MSDCCGCNSGCNGGIFGGTNIWWIVIAIIVIVWLSGESSNGCC